MPKFVNSVQVGIVGSTDKVHLSWDNGVTKATLQSSADLDVLGGDSVGGVGGTLIIAAGPGGDGGGELSLKGGDGANADSPGGNLSILGGGTAGGDASGGAILIAPGGASGTGLGGALTLAGGSGDGGTEPRVQMTLTGATDVDPGQLTLTNIPVADPSISDAIWSDGGVLVFSGSTAPASGGAPSFAFLAKWT